MATRLGNGLTPSENGRIVASIITENDLEELQGLQGELLDRVAKAREDGRLFMMQQYLMLVAGITPQIKRIRDRFDRETLAGLRKHHKMLKLEAKEAAENGASA